MPPAAGWDPPRREPVLGLLLLLPTGPVPRIVATCLRPRHPLVQRLGQGKPRRSLAHDAVLLLIPPNEAAAGPKGRLWPPAMEWVPTEHARVVMQERGIPSEWVDRVLAAPTTLLPDSRDPALSHATGPIAERQERVLRVVHDRSEIPFRVATVFFDRRLRP